MTSTIVRLLPWEYDDGGRAAHFKGKAGDCVARAIAIAGQVDYYEAFRILADGNAAQGRARTANDGTDKSIYRPYLEALGFQWVPTMGIGTGARYHLAGDLFEHPRLASLMFRPRIIARLSKHLTTIIDGQIRDTFDPSRDGTRAVYGFWYAPGRTT